MASPQGIAIRCSRTSHKPVTPDQSSKHLLPHTNNVEASPDGGVSLGPSDSAYKQLITNNILTNHGHAQITATATTLAEPNTFPPSPSRLANIRVRRANNGSALLKSPARAGHAARMRQIFEDAGRDHQFPQPEQSISYPQLPNISRKASPPLEHNRDDVHHTPTSAVQRPKTLSKSASSFRMVSHATQVNSPRVSEQSSESWSDDSGYFIAGSRNRTSSLTGLPRDRIQEWLTSVSAREQEPCAVQDSLDDHSASQPPSPPIPTTNDVSSKETLPSPPQVTTTNIQDPFLCTSSPLRTSPLFKALPPRRPRTQPHTPAQPQTHHPTSTVTIRSHDSPTKQSILQDGGIQLSPLSPNVCIERGPSRYHSARASPIKDRQALRFTVKENQRGVRLDKGKGKESGDAEEEEHGSPLAPCKIGVGTRFQHARHGVRGLPRFGRCLES